MQSARAKPDEVHALQSGMGAFIGRALIPFRGRGLHLAKLRKIAMHAISTSAGRAARARGNKFIKAGLRGIVRANMMRRFK